uniref:Epidermal differentiation protein n=1 Tax=Malurus cyaneus samueli TaxID=2593467 RepID=A0A8C5U8N4_9PASS
MSYYGYQYKQQCFYPAGTQFSAVPAVPQQCQGAGAVSCTSCSPCAPAGTKICTVRKTLSPRCAGPCRQGCVETRVVEGHRSSSSSCSSSRCLEPCSVPFPQPPVQGRELCVPNCGQTVTRRCPQMCAPAPVCQDSPYPYSYQWSNSYQYNCGQ